MTTHPLHPLAAAVAGLMTPTATLAAHTAKLFSATFGTHTAPVVTPRHTMVWPGGNPINAAMTYASRPTPAELETVAKSFREAAQALADGHGTRKHWAALCSAVNVGVAIEDGGVVRGLRTHLDEAHTVLTTVAQRAGEFRNPPGWTAPKLSNTEADACHLLAKLHTYQLAQLGHGEYQAAVRLAVGRVRSGGGVVIGRVPCRDGNSRHGI